MDLTVSQRIAQLKAMHDLMCESDDEELYLTWIEAGIPDEADWEYFRHIAENTDEFRAVFKLFLVLINAKSYLAAKN